MTERLKQIWGGFEKATTRRLTGRGVDNIEVPHRTEWRAGDAPLPDDFSAPADAAFSALKHRLAESERALWHKERRGRGPGAKYPGANYSGAASLPPLPEEQGAPKAAQDLIRGLKSTEMRITRRDADYGAWLASTPKGALKLQPRKRFFGLF